MQNDLLVCGNCGFEFQSSSDGRVHVCPNCGADVVMEDAFRAGAGVGVAGIKMRVCAAILAPALLFRFCAG